MAKYIIGVDFGTLSARAILVDAATGEERKNSAVHEYRHAVMETALPDGTPLPVDYALQDPRDYRESLGAVTRDVMVRNNVRPADVIGLGIDFTADRDRKSVV